MRKKFTMLFALLLACVCTAWAQQIAGDADLNNNSAYTINSQDRGYLYYDADNGDYVTSTSHTDITDDTPTGAENEQFAFLRTENTADGEYYLYSIGASKFVTYTGDNDIKLELTAAPVCTWTLSEADGLFVIMVPGTTNTCINVTNWNAHCGTKVTGTGADGGNKMEIVKVTEVDLSAALEKVVTFETPTAYQKISHAKWTVTSFNQTPVQQNGVEGGVDFIKDENPSTFYHSNWSGSNEGKEGKQGFLIQMAESYTIDKITYEGRSDNNTSGWARGVRIYVYEQLPTDFPTDLSLCKGKDKENFLANEAVLGTPAFDNNNNPWADDRTTKTAEFATPQKGKYIFFVMDSGHDNWLTCSEFHAWQKIMGIEQDKPYYLKLVDVEGGYLDIKTGLSSDYGNTVAKTSEGVCAYFTLNNGYWHISSEAGHKGNFLGVANWDAKPGQASPANWTLHKDDTYDCWYLAQNTYYGGSDATKHYLGANNGNISGQDKLYTDKPIAQAAKIVFEAVPYAEVTFNYYDGETKFASANVIFDVNEVLSIEDVPAVDFYTNSSFKSAGDVIATNGASIDVTCTATFPFDCAIVDAEGNIEGPWYKLNQGDRKIALTDADNRVNFVSDNDNNNGLWAFVKVEGYKFKIYNRACPGVAMAAVKNENASYQNYNQATLYVAEKEESITEFIISKNVDGFNIQIPGELINNWYATAGNHISGNFGFWSKADAAPITENGSRLSVTLVADPDIALAKGALQSRVDELNVMVGLQGVNPGEYKVEEMAKLVAPIAAAQEVLDSDVKESAAYNNALAALNEAIKDVDLTMNPVVAGTYRIISAKPAFNGSMVMSAYALYNGKHAYPGWTGKDDNDPLQYWVLEAAENGKFTMKAADGNYITSVNSITETATGISFVSVGKAQFNIKLGDNKSPLHCNYHNYGYGAGPLLEYDGTVDTPSAWKLEAVAELPEFTYELTVGTTGYATLMLGFNATIPEGVTCYTAVVDGDVAKLAAVEGGVLAANTPVIVEAAANKCTFTSTTSAVTTPASNELKGTLYPKLITAAENTTYYVLAAKEGVVGLYKASLNQSSNTAFLNNANKVYLPVEVAESDAAPMFSFTRGDEEDTTGIELISNDGGLVIYDLAGRRVEKMEKGIYIVNGRKVIR